MLGKKIKQIVKLLTYKIKQLKRILFEFVRSVFGNKEFNATKGEYLKAIDILDNNYNMQYAINKIVPTARTLSNGPNTLKNSVYWGCERLPLMLMLGMTYERENKLFLALSHYRDAHSFARKLVSTYLALISQNISKTESISQYLPDHNKPLKGRTSFNVLKYFNILYQPLFAEAWLIEKTSGGLDTSIGILERGICQLRESLPYINKMYGNEAISATKYAHSDFLLIASQLHNKTGDLVFFKGNQNDAEKLNGYLYRAIYHYSVALHELRRFICYRYRTSGIKFDPTESVDKCSASSERPDYVILALSSNLMDIGESTIAKIDVIKLVKSLRSIKKNIDRYTNELYTPLSFFKKIDNWVEQSSNKCNEVSEKTKNKLLFRVSDDEYISCGHLFEWIGEWEITGEYESHTQKYGKTKEGKSYPDILKFDKKNNDIQRLFIGLYFSWTGIHYLEKGSYFESASKEYLELANSISTILWWHLTINKGEELEDVDRLIPLSDLSICCLKKAVSMNFKNKSGKVASHVNDEFQLEKNTKRVVNPEFITTAYSLYLLCIENKAYKQCREISKMLSDWRIHNISDFYFYQSNQHMENDYKNKLIKTILNKTRKTFTSNHNIYVFNFASTLKNTSYDLFVSQTSTFLGNTKEQLDKSVNILIKNQINSIINLEINDDELKKKISLEIATWGDDQVNDIFDNKRIITFLNGFTDLFFNKLNDEINNCEPYIIPIILTDIFKIRLHDINFIKNDTLIKKIDSLDKNRHLESVISDKCRNKFKNLFTLFFKDKNLKFDDIKKDVLELIKSNLNKELKTIIIEIDSKNILDEFINKLFNKILRVLEERLANLFKATLHEVFSTSPNYELTCTIKQGNSTLNNMKLNKLLINSFDLNCKNNFINKINIIVKKANSDKGLHNKLKESIIELGEKQFKEVAINNIEDDESLTINDLANNLKVKNYIKNKLKSHLLFSHSQMLNRLRGLSVLTYSTYMTTSINQEDENIQSNELKSITSTLLYHNNLYDSPFRFVGMESGLCAYLTYIMIKSCNKKKHLHDKLWYKKMTRKYINESISIHTMGKSFYENIMGLYYLDDDFNDRRVHMGHALQMLGTNYAQFILDKIDEE